MCTPNRIRTLAAFSTACILAANTAGAQLTYSIDHHGPTISLKEECGGVLKIDEGTILTTETGSATLGPLGRPCIETVAGTGGLGLALADGCDPAPGSPCFIEVDALSHGGEFVEDITPNPGRWWFSADEFARGRDDVFGFPSLLTEGFIAASDAAADALVVEPLPNPPLPPTFDEGRHWGAYDGNGFRSESGFSYPGLGLLERHEGGLPDIGDNLDAIDADDSETPFFDATYYSLDGDFMDPLTGMPLSGSAAAHGFVGADVLITPLGGSPTVWAPAGGLGLDRFGPGTDDVDAIAVWENPIAGWQPSVVPYDWVDGTHDMLLFSVRRGSVVIGMLDSRYGEPIEPGDILTPPVPPGMGGVSLNPAIFVPAERLGLRTARFGWSEADDMDALDYVTIPIKNCNGNMTEDALDIGLMGFPDCNSNGVPDSCDVSSGRSYDFDMSGVPDECECGSVFHYCTAKVNSAGCTPLIGSSGTPSMSDPDPFTIEVVNVISIKPGIVFYGFAPGAIPFQGGLRCVSGAVVRTPVQTSTGQPPSNCTGTYSFDMNAWIQSGIDDDLTVGTTVFAQYWSRDPFSAPFFTGLSDAISFTICP